MNLSFHWLVVSDLLEKIEMVFLSSKMPLQELAQMVEQLFYFIVR